MNRVIPSGRENGSESGRPWPSAHSTGGAHGRQEQVRRDSGIGRARCLKETNRPATRSDDQDEQSFLGAPGGRLFDLGFIPERLELAILPIGDLLGIEALSPAVFTQLNFTQTGSLDDNGQLVFVA